MTADYPPLPFTPAGVPSHARGAWWAATQLIGWLVDWADGDTLRTYPPELTTGHAALCTARYDSEGICHEHAECALIAIPGECGDPGCLVFEWADVPGIDGPVLVCVTHRLPGPGWSYNADWHERPRIVAVPLIPPCTCKPARRTFHFWSYSVVRRTSSRVRIDPRCWHHGDGYRW